jgi:hypothetical protein
MEFHPGLEAGRLFTVLANAHVPGGHALDAAIRVIEHFSGGEAGVDFHPQRLGLLAQPATEIAQADNVVAVIGHLRRCRQLITAGLGEEQEAILAGGRIEWRTTRLPVGEKRRQCAWLNDRARQNMRTNLRAFFQQADRHLPASLGRQLLETNRR